MGTADVNWMLGASVQSGAALVAIVGGILGSRFVSLDAERQAANRRLSDVRKRRETAEADEAAAIAAWTKLRVEYLLDRDEVYKVVNLAGRDAPSAEQALEPAEIRQAGVPIEALERHLQLIHSEMQQAVSELKDMIPEQEDLPVWDEFRRSFRIDPIHDGTWAWVYDEIADVREETVRERRIAEAKARGGLAGIVASSTRISPRHLVKNSVDTAQVEEAAADAKRRDCASKRSVLEAEEALAIDHANAAVPPAGFKLALSVLAYVAVSTIAFPLALMVAAPMTLPLWLRVVVALAFLSGLLVLFRYLHAYAEVLRTGVSDHAMPSSLAKLLTRRATT